MFYMITKEDCPWCDKALDLIVEQDKGERIIFGSVDAITKRLMLKAGLRTVPQVWKDDEYIGGYQELVAYFEQQGDVT